MRAVGLEVEAEAKRRRSRRLRYASTPTPDPSARRAQNSSSTPGGFHCRFSSSPAMEALCQVRAAHVHRAAPLTEERTPTLEYVVDRCPAFGRTFSVPTLYLLVAFRWDRWNRLGVFSCKLLTGGRSAGPNPGASTTRLAALSRGSLVAGPSPPLLRHGSLVGGRVTHASRVVSRARPGGPESRDPRHSHQFFDVLHWTRPLYPGSLSDDLLVTLLAFSVG
jgi:hypothetical protein